MSNKKKYWEYLERNKSRYESQYFQEISCLLAELAASKFDDFGMEALQFTKGLIDGSSNEEFREEIIEKLQTYLNNDGLAHHFSPLIWALQEDTPGYPSWYSTGIVAMNIEELKLRSETEIVDFIKDRLKRKTVHNKTYKQ